MILVGIGNYLKTLMKGFRVVELTNIFILKQYPQLFEL